MRPAVVSLAALSFVTLLGAPAIAAGNLAAGGDELELKIDTADLKFSQNEFDLETGTYYRLTISSDGGDAPPNTQARPARKRSPPDNVLTTRTAAWLRNAKRASAA